MLVTANALNITKTFELSQRQTQALVDFETALADLGLMVWFICRTCESVGDPSSAEGNSEHHADGTMTFMVKCNCTTRVFRGNLALPKPPRPLRDPRVDLSVKPELPLSREFMRAFNDADTVLIQLRMNHAMRCLACRMENRDRDGVRGKSESNASQFVLECDCTKRVYRGSDAPLSQ